MIAMSFLFLIICCHLTAVIYCQPFRVAVDSTRTGDRGNHFFIHCQHLNNGSSVVQANFYRNGVSFNDDYDCMRDHAIVFTNGSAMIRLSPSCEGHIQCGAIKILSEPIQICAYPELLPGTSSNRINMNSLEGENITLPCPISVSRLNGFNINWYKGINEIADADINPRDYSITLVADIGTYYCRATTTKLQDGRFSLLTGPQIDLSVQRRHVSPQFLSNMTYSQDGNSNHIFSIRIHGTSPLKFAWYLNTTRINSSLELIHSQDGHTANISSQITLHELPAIINGPTKLTVTAHNNDSNTNSNHTLHTISQTGLLLPYMVVNPSSTTTTTSSPISFTVSPTVMCSNSIINNFNEWISSVDIEILELLTHTGALLVLGTICVIQLLIIICLSITVCCCRLKKQKICKRIAEAGGTAGSAGTVEGNDRSGDGPGGVQGSGEGVEEDSFSCRNSIVDIFIEMASKYCNTESNDRALSTIMGQIILDITFKKTLTDEDLVLEFERVFNQLCSHFGRRIVFNHQVSSRSTNGQLGSIDEIDPPHTARSPIRYDRRLSTDTTLAVRTPLRSFTAPIPSMETHPLHPINNHSPLSGRPILVQVPQQRSSTNANGSMNSNTNANGSINSNINGSDNDSIDGRDSDSYSNPPINRDGRKTVRQTSCEDYIQALKSPITIDDGVITTSA